jgi:hypothetical protein
MCEVQELAFMTYRLAELDGVRVPIPDDEEVDANALVADLEEPARAVTHEQLDEGRRASTIATSWLRSKAALSAGVVAETATRWPGRGAGNHLGAAARDGSGLRRTTIPGSS